MAMTTVEEKDQLAIETTLKGLLPVSAYLQCKTADQKRLFESTTQRFQFLRVKLESYFRNQPEIDDSFLPNDERELLEAEKDAIIAFYSLVKSSWPQIVQKCKEKGIDLSTYGIFSAGDVISFCLKAEADIWVENYLSGYYEWSPKALLKGISECDKVDALLSKKNYSALTKPEKAKVDRLVNKYNRSASKASGIEGLKVKHLVLDICEKMAKGRAGSKEKRRLEAYNTAQSEVYLRKRSMMHPNKGVRGFKLVKGEMLPLGTSRKKEVKKAA